MPNDFESRFNNAVKKAASEEYRRVRKELLEKNQNEAAEILGHDMRHYQRLESGEGTANLSKHFSNIFTLLKHYFLGIKDTKLTTQSSGYLHCHGEIDEQQAQEIAEKEAREIIMRVISNKGGEDDHGH